MNSSTHGSPQKKFLRTAFGPLFLAGALCGSSSAEETTTEWLKPSITFSGEYWKVAGGGVDKDSFWNYLADLSLEADLSPAGKKGENTIFLQVFASQSDRNSFFCDYTGSFHPSSNIMAGEMLRLYEAFFRKSWDDDKYVLKIGQLAADADFMTSEYSALFLNSQFGAMASQVATPLASSHCISSAYPIFAVASPGIFFSASPAESVKLKAAAYVGEPGEDCTDNHGWDWGISSASGAGFFYEGEWTYSANGLPGALRAGGTFHTGLFEDLEATHAGEEDAVKRGLYGFYFIADQALIAAPAPSSAKGEKAEKSPAPLGAFFRVGWSPEQDRSFVSTSADTGIVWNGPFGREKDSAGLAYSYTRFGPAFRDTEKFETAAGEHTFELTYRCQLTHWWALQADAQFVLDPSCTNNASTATVLGLRTDFTF